MNFLILVLILCLFIFLYIVYLLSKDDFVILRHNVSLEKIFNAAFLFGLSGLFFSRLFYIVLDPKPVFYSLLGFILFPYFPGLSLIGGILGGFGFCYIYFKSRLLPVARLMDFFSVAFIGAFPIGLIGTLVLEGGRFAIYTYLSIILSFLYLFAFIKFILPASLGSKLKDGSLSFIFFASFPLLYILIRILLSNLKSVLNAENLISLGVFVFSLVLVLRREQVLRLIIERWKNRK